MIIAASAFIGYMYGERTKKEIECYEVAVKVCNDYRI